MTREERLALWRLKTTEFNTWRRNNDIPRLFDFFADRLPLFRDWISTFFPNIDYLLQQDFPGRFMFGETDMTIISYIQENGDQVINVLPLNHQISQNIRNRPVKIVEDRPYVPYIQWARRKFKGKPFILSDRFNNSYSDNIDFRSWSHPIGHPEDITAFIFGDHPVLSLGGVDLPNGVIINGRNLDFTCLDFLGVTGAAHGSTWCYICYASCRNIMYDEIQHAFVSFQNCHVDDFEVRNSRLQDYEFDNCDIVRSRFEDSYINGLRIRNSVFAQPTFRNTELYGFEYQPAKRVGYVGQFDTMRRIRLAFQSMGRREEACKYYFFERVFERKAIAVPFSFVRREFPPVPHGGRFLDLLRNWHRMRSSVRWRLLRKILVYRATIGFKPKYLFKIIRYRLRYLASLVESILWGYGEKPFRPIRNSFIIIVLFSVFYYFSGHTELHRSVINSIYFSIVTFTTLGLGDINPGTSLVLKGACALEALLGAITMGFLVAALANKSKY